MHPSVLNVIIFLIHKMSGESSTCCVISRTNRKLKKKTNQEKSLTCEIWLIEDSMRRSWDAWISSIWRTLLAKVLIR